MMMIDTSTTWGHLEGRPQWNENRKLPTDLLLGFVVAIKANLCLDKRQQTPTLNEYPEPPYESR